MWLFIARQVLVEEFNGGSRSLLDSVAIGLRGMSQPEARQALEQLRKAPR